MKICVAQIRPIKGDIPGNIENHLKLIELSVSKGANMVIFPELSLTGYEPELAKELATYSDDNRFDDFQKISDAGPIVIGVGVPLKENEGICISMLIFQPFKARQIYSKKYLHPDEQLYFVSGDNSSLKLESDANIAFAICYELSVPEHSEKAFRNGTQIYLASVAKTKMEVNKAIDRLSETASKYSMTVLMSNCIGECDGKECAGNTSIWDDKGVLLGQLNGTNEGLLIFDTETQEIIKLD